MLDIVLACKRLQSFTSGTDESGFVANEEKCRAVVSQLVIIGEAVRHLSAAFQAQHPAAPWTQVCAMRNCLVHEYGRMNWRLVWRTATEEVPALLLELEPLVHPDKPA